VYNTLPTTLEIELSTRCNAACPQCSRNYFGAYTWPTLPLVNIDIDLLTKSLSKSFLQNLTKIRLIGTYGEPCLHPNFLQFIEWLTIHTQASIIISTNASLRPIRWWRKLAKLLRPIDRVVFCVDGLEDTNHLYRKGTDFAKIIRNMVEFNQAGGKSIWNYIVFRHNEHQVEQAKKMSVSIGCADFTVKRTARFINKQHKRIEKFPVLDSKEKVQHWLELPAQKQFLNNGYDQYTDIIANSTDYDNYLKTAPIDCIAQSHSACYISAEGYVLPCGWLADRFYGFEAENHSDRQKLFDLIEQSGGLNAISVFEHSIESILDGNFFKLVQSSWTDENRLERCANQCGKYISAYTLSAAELNEKIKQ
jgi:MoaA/NifB/PqqE/SkfB family radical SAM enzyme